MPLVLKKIGTEELVQKCRQSGWYVVFYRRLKKKLHYQTIIIFLLTENGRILAKNMESWDYNPVSSMKAALIEGLKRTVGKLFAAQFSLHEQQQPYNNTADGVKPSHVEWWASQSFPYRKCYASVVQCVSQSSWPFKQREDTITRDGGKTKDDFKSLLLGSWYWKDRANWSMIYYARFLTWPFVPWQESQTATHHHFDWHLSTLKFAYAFSWTLRREADRESPSVLSGIV